MRWSARLARRTQLTADIGQYEGDDYSTTAQALRVGDAYGHKKPVENVGVLILAASARRWRGCAKRSGAGRLRVTPMIASVPESAKVQMSLVTWYWYAPGTAFVDEEQQGIHEGEPGVGWLRRGG